MLSNCSSSFIPQSLRSYVQKIKHTPVGYVKFVFKKMMSQLIEHSCGENERENLCFPSKENAFVIPPMQLSTSPENLPKCVHFESTKPRYLQPSTSSSSPDEYVSMQTRRREKQVTDDYSRDPKEKCYTMSTRTIRCKSRLPIWQRNERIEIVPNAELEKLPKACPRFLLENKKRWNRRTQSWESYLEHVNCSSRINRYKFSTCPFHRGYDL